MVNLRPEVAIPIDGSILLKPSEKCFKTDGIPSSKPIKCAKHSSRTKGNFIKIGREGAAKRAAYNDEMSKAVEAREHVQRQIDWRLNRASNLSPISWLVQSKARLIQCHVHIGVRIFCNAIEMDI